jgi:Putative MetA-pathway of phenol degradation
MVLIITQITTLLLFGPLTSVLAQGGPPMLTDDPGTPGDKHWEINVACVTEHARDGAGHNEAPLLDLNYGIGERIQLKYEIAWLVANEPGQSSRAGLGDSEIGVKWRFFDDAASGLAISAYPQLAFNNPTSSEQRGLVDGGTTLVLPFEFQGTLGSLEWNAEIGRSFSERGEDEWLYGFAIGRKINDQLELAAELHGAGRFAYEDDEVVVNFGVRLKLAEHQTLLVSVGRSVNKVHGEELTYLGYLGLQLTY